MTEQEIAAYKEQVFAQSSTQPQPQAIVPTEPTTEESKPTSTEPASPTPTPSTEPSEEIIDADEYAVSLGYKNFDELKTDIPQLKQFKETAPKPIEYANEESKKVHELLLAGKVKEVKAIYDLQEKLEAVDTLTPADAIKLHIEQTNKHYKKADVEDVFEEKYSYPEKPEQTVTESDEEFAERETKYKNAVEKINRRIERDSVTAKEELAKFKTEIKLPTIPTSENKDLEELAFIRENQKKAQEDHKILVSNVSKLSEKDLSFQLNFNDEASKIKFDVSYQAEKEGVEKAKAAAIDYIGFLSQTYYKEDGSPLVDKLANDIYFLQNKEKIMTDAINQAVNATKAWFLRTQKNIGDGVQRNFNTFQPDALQKLKEQVFG